MPLLRYLRTSSVALALTLLAAGNLSAKTSEPAPFVEDVRDFSAVLTGYKNAQASKPLNYRATGVESLPEVEKRTFELRSQYWSPLALVEPGEWVHEVAIYIPQGALPGQALLVANNGTNHPRPRKEAEPATDFTQTMALSIAKRTRTIVITTSNVPNQYLSYNDDGVARREDDSVAHSWKLFLKNPEQRPTLSLHIPMMQSMIRTMDLAERELKPWKVDRFIATGASKRGWVSWLAALTDERITAIVPFVIDILGMDKVLEHTWQTYGKSWPVAFGAYQREGITQQIKTANFDKLMQIEDPLRYLDSAYAHRLAIPKYIVNASGDDFFVPDNARFFFNQLPGEKALRVAPNSSHYGIQHYVESALVPFINRLRQSRPMPSISMQSDADRAQQRYAVLFSEPPTKVVQWTATNALARDFRHACGIRYQPQELNSATDRLVISLKNPTRGWTASFVEATFSDGMVVTTPVHILPQRYPAQPPPQSEPACKTLPGA
ncbi:PhoPQ-activated pathogenicity-like protein [Paucimonas lemoignei]|nr:PhoPQ-activated pathogenicity-like protein [Paucimonas lemoignei]